MLGLSLVETALETVEPSMDDVAGEISHLLPRLLQESAERAVTKLPALYLRQCESQIEQLFLCAVWARAAWFDELEFGLFASEETQSQYTRLGGGAKTVCAPQVYVGPYRVDFLFSDVMSGGEPVSLVAVECDGHEFHEKTKQQAARDKARDREITSYGIKVLRFTGSEIWKDAGRCADEVLGFLSAERANSFDRFEQRVVREHGSVTAYLCAVRERDEETAP